MWTSDDNFSFRRVRLTAISHERVLEIEGKELSRLLRSDSVDKNANYVLAEVRINLSGLHGRASPTFAENPAHRSTVVRVRQDRIQSNFTLGFA